MSTGIDEPTALFANLGLSALALGAFYFIVAFLVLKKVRRVRSLSPPNWNTLRVFCWAILIFPLLRGIAFTFHFLLEEGETVGINWPSIIRDILMNLLFIFPAFIFLLTYIILICMWIEITLFSRDQYLIQREAYSKVWKIIYFTIVFFTLSGVIVCFVLSITQQSAAFLNALFFSLWVMDFVIPALSAIIYIILIIRFAGFPYYDDIWRQQSNRINRIIFVWTFADIISGTMIAVWSDKEHNGWTNDDSHLWFQISVFATVFVSEIGPILWVSEWSNLGFLLIAFDNWRTLFIENPRTAQQHAPLLSDDPYAQGVPGNNMNNSAMNNNNNNNNMNSMNNGSMNKQLNIPILSNQKNANERTQIIMKSGDYNFNESFSSRNNLDNISMKTTPSKYHSLTGGNIGNANGRDQSDKNHSLISGLSIQSVANSVDLGPVAKSSFAIRMQQRKQMDFTHVAIDDTMNLPSAGQTAHATTHKGVCSNIDVCVKSLRIINVPSTMVQAAIGDVEKFCIEWDHLYLGAIFGIRIIDNNNNIICINSSSYDEMSEILRHNSGNFMKSLKKFEIINKWYTNGSLWDIIEAAPKDTPFAPQVVLRIAIQIAQFLKWLHVECGTCHGYLKSRNILFDDSMNVKITDIGLIGLKRSMQIMLHDCNFDGYWLDKEYFEGNPIKSDCDIWAFGFVLYELISKRDPFPKCNFDEIKKRILKHQLPQIPNHCPAYIRTLIQKCWHKDRESRPSINEIIKELHQNL